MMPEATLNSPGYINNLIYSMHVMDAIPLSGQHNCEGGGCGVGKGLEKII